MEKKSYTIAIVDDETMFRVLTKKKLAEVMKKLPFTFYVQEYKSGAAFLAKKKVFDIVFMDIAMPKMSGIEAAAKYREYCPEGILIFLTAYDDYMKDGYKVNAFRYIGKQDEPKEFFEAVKSAVLQLQEKEQLKLQVVSGGEIFVALNDIVYVEAQTRSVLVHTKDGEILPVRQKISDLTQLLEEKGFFLIHRLYLVNLRYAKSCDKKEVVLYTAETIPISEKRRHEFKVALKEFHS